MKIKLNVFAFLTFFFTLITTFSLGEILYNSIDGTDFYRYFRYIEYFNGEIDSPSREQGLFYFWYIYLFIDFYEQFYLADKWEFIYSSAIQMGNFTLYLVGLVGLFQFLKLKNFSTHKILISFSFLNLFPPVFGGRLIMKPEILAFTLMPWIIFGISKYLKNKKLFYLLSTTPLLALIATSKGTVFVITAFALLFIFYKNLKEISVSHILSSTALFFLMSYLVFIENLEINNVSMISHPEESSYLYRASASFLYNINFGDLINNPFRNTHADSFIGITLIDLFGDYFNRYWDHERSLFFQNRVDLISFVEHPRRILSILLSFVFIVLSFVRSRNNKNINLKIIYLVGIVVLLLTSLGLFGLHFNPNKGDTVKTHYYFFLLAISFVFIIINYLNKVNSYNQYFSLLMFFIFFLFIVGFPKNFDGEFNSKLADKTPTTISCRYLGNYIEKLTNLDVECLTKTVATCGFFTEYNLPKQHEDGYLIFQEDELFKNTNLTDKDGNSVTVRGYAECLHYLEGGFQKSEVMNKENRSPASNKIVFYLNIFSIVYLFSTKREKNNV